MEILIRDTPEAGAKVGANVVRKIIKDKDNPVLGLATGGTPLRMYKELIRMNQSGEISFRNCTTFNLDEYGGLSPKNKHSYYYMMNIFSNTPTLKVLFLQVIPLQFLRCIPV